MSTATLPQLPMGVSLNESHSLLPKLELFLDLQCQACAKTWKTFKPMIDEIKSNLIILIHLTPLPLHLNSFILTEAAEWIKNHNGKDSFFKFIDWLFMEDNYKKFQNDATIDMSRAQLIEMLSNSLSGMGINREQFISDMKSERFLTQAQNRFKYNVTRRVDSTPQCFLNDLPVENFESTWSTKEWHNILQPIMKKGATRR